MSERQNMQSNPFVVEKLENGLTVVMEIMSQSKSAACGFLARTGGRDDPAGLAGVSHFLEHMLFKGTPRRTWADINIEFDEMGAHYNAWTSKDRTFFYSWVRTADLDRQLELLADMMRSTLPVQEFEMEKKVVLEEIAMSNDDLSSTAYDFLYEQFCPGNPLAWPILGTESSVGQMSRDQMAGYFTRRYAPNNLILVVAGNVEPAQVLASARRLTADWTPAPDLGAARVTPTFRTGQAVKQVDRFHQQAIIMAFPSCSAIDPLDETAEAAAAILGGQNSRFYWKIVQQGLATQASVFREDYADFSIMILFALCEPENCEQVYTALTQQAEELLTRPAEAREVQRVKNLRRTSLANESEAPYYRLGQLIDDMDYRGRPRSTEERMAAVNAVSAASIEQYLHQYPLTRNGLLVSVGPRVWPA